MPDFGTLPVKYLIGIDESGRGPIAGPVAVGAVLLPLSTYAGIPFRDSKHLPQHKREAVYSELIAKQGQGLLSYSVAMSGPELIDRHGLMEAVSRAIKRVLKNIDAPPEDAFVLLDGGLRAPKRYRLQQTFVRGDETIYPIALASVAAKVKRDAYMRRQALRFPAYGFDQHKGYGTREHYKRISKNGLCAIHRQSFLTALTKRSGGVY